MYNNVHTQKFIKQTKNGGKQLPIFNNTDGCDAWDI